MAVAYYRYIKIKLSGPSTAIHIINTIRRYSHSTCCLFQVHFFFVKMNKVVYSGKKGSKTSFPAKSKRTINHRKPPNRHAFEKDCAETSTLAKKMKQSSSAADIEVDPTFSYTFINFIPVFTALAQILVCKTCGSEVKFTQSSMRGLGFKINVSCGNCENTIISNCPMINNKAYINPRSRHKQTPNICNAFARNRT